MCARLYSLEMVRQLLERDTVMAGRPAAGGHVVATCRNPDAALELAELLRAHPTRQGGC